MSRRRGRGGGPSHASLRALLPIALLLLSALPPLGSSPLAPSMVTALQVSQFPGLGTQVTLGLMVGEQTSQHLTIPGPGAIVAANLSVAAPDEGVLAPLEPTLEAQGSTLWNFSGLGYGAFGRQELFADDHRDESVWVTKTTMEPATVQLRLPAGATVRSAQLDISVPATGMQETPQVIYTTDAADDHGGWSVAGVGDFNADGLGDFVAGVPDRDQSTIDDGLIVVMQGDEAQPSQLTNLQPQDFGERLGISVDGAGDVNGDGWADIIGGAPANDVNGSGAGRAYIWFGGPSYSSVPNVTLTCVCPGGSFGWAVAGVGDTDGDGFDDVLVGAPNIAPAGEAFLYYGGASMDTTPARVYTGGSSNAAFGSAVGGGGDLDDDGLADYVISAPHQDRLGAPGSNTGRVLVFSGASPDQPSLLIDGLQDDMNFGTDADIVGDLDGDGRDDLAIGAVFGGLAGSAGGNVQVLLGNAPIGAMQVDLTITTDTFEELGDSLDGAGDINADGFDDLIVGAPYYAPGGTNHGRVKVFYGAETLDGTADLVLGDSETNSFFGSAVAGAGDVTGDGQADLVMGGPFNGSANVAGHVALYGHTTDLTSPILRVDGVPAWSTTNLALGATAQIPLTSALNAALTGATNLQTDTAGNVLATLNLTFTLSSDQGRLDLDEVQVDYDAATRVDLMSTLVQAFPRPHVTDIDVALNLSAQSNGSIRLQQLEVEVDTPPSFSMSGPIHLPEDSSDPMLLDLWETVSDDETPQEALRLTVTPLSNDTIVNVTLEQGRYLSVDAASGALNDNWTGEMRVRVEASDVWGMVAQQELLVVVDPVADVPAFASSPPQSATIGTAFSYTPTVVDGDDDATLLRLSTAPLGMDLDDGTLRWVPTMGQIGSRLVELIALDDDGSSAQTFWVSVLPAPPLTFLSPDESSYPARVGALIELHVVVLHPVAQPSGSPLQIDVSGGPEELDLSDPVAIDQASGGPRTQMTIRWVPDSSWLQQALPLSITARSPYGEGSSNVSIVVGANLPPRFLSEPPPTGTINVPYEYAVVVRDDDDDAEALHFSLGTHPVGMTIDPTNGTLDWTPTALGPSPAEILVSDGANIEAQRFDVLVRAVPPSRNTAPTLQLPSATRVVVGKTLSIDLHARDPNGDPLVFTVLTPLPGLNVTDGRLVWRPSSDQLGRHLVRVQVSDGLLTAEDSVAITVVGEEGRTDVVLGPSLPWLALLALIALGFVVGIVLLRRRSASDAELPPPGALSEQVPPPPVAFPHAPPPTAEGAAPHRLPGHGGGSAGLGAATAQTSGLPPPSGITPELPEVPPFSVIEVHMIYRDGRAMLHAAVQEKEGVDQDLMASMLVAIQQFVTESFTGRGSLDMLTFGHYHVVLRRSTNLVLAVIVEGEVPLQLPEECIDLLQRVESLYEGLLVAWDGDTEHFQEARKLFLPLFTYHRKFRFARKPSHPILRSSISLEGGYVRLRLKVVNPTDTVLADARVQLRYDERILRLDRIAPMLQHTGGTLRMGTVLPDAEVVIDLFFDPLICQESFIDGTLSYGDASGALRHVDMKRRVADVVCPIFYTPHSVPLAVLRRLLADATELDARVFRLPAGLALDRAVDAAGEVICAYDVQLVRRLSEGEPPSTIEAWFYGKVTGSNEEIVVRATIGGQPATLQVVVVCSNVASLTGLLAELGGKLRQRLAGLDRESEVDLEGVLDRTRTLLERSARGDSPAIHSEGPPEE